jgi:hypothetical protein
MKLFRISQTQNENYDSYDSAVVAAETEDVARAMNPYRGTPNDFAENSDVWCSCPEEVQVEYLGEAVEGTERGVIVASFNAG